ncbi:putative Peroxidase 48 [Nymphaea colorata]|nr:putative Peroxidase 48 [Nymphaea colorata]
MRALSRSMMVGIFITFCFSIQNSTHRRQDDGQGQRDSLFSSSAIAGNSNGNPDQLPGLQYDFYREACPEAEFVIRKTVQDFVTKRSDVAPGLLRLAFHDCFVQGCDASVLLDSREGAPSEKEASANKNSLRGFDVIDAVKERLEHLCPLTVSCADIVALSARDAIFLTGGPFYPLSTGRRDGRVSRAATAEAQLPSPFDTLAAILAAFNERGLHQNDTITLLGAHTIGHTHCRFVQSRLYNFSGDGSPDPTMNSTLAESLKLICPEDDDEEADMDGRTKLPMDFGGHDTFDSHFYQNVVEGYGVLYADQQLMASAATANLVVDYAIDSDLFRREFARAMVKLSSVGVLTGSQGEVRRDCRRLLEDEPTGLNGG